MVKVLITYMKLIQGHVVVCNDRPRALTVTATNIIAENMKAML
jgi:hypothetical protein